MQDVGTTKDYNPWCIITPLEPYIGAPNSCFMHSIEEAMMNEDNVIGYCTLYVLCTHSDRKI